MTPENRRKHHISTNHRKWINKLSKFASFPVRRGFQIVSVTQNFNINNQVSLKSVK